RPAMKTALAMPAKFRAVILGPIGHKARVQAMQDGIAALGGEVVSVPDSTLPALQLALRTGAVAFAVACGMHARERIARGYLRGLGIPLLVLDCGWFRRAGGAQDGEGYSQLGLGRLNWVPPIDCDRPATRSRFEEHGITVAEPV